MKLFIINKKIVGESVMTPSKYDEVNEWVMNLNDKKKAEMWYFDDGTVQMCNASEVFGTVYNFVSRIGNETSFIPDAETRSELRDNMSYRAAVALLSGDENGAREHGYRIVKNESGEYVEFELLVKNAAPDKTTETPQTPHLRIDCVNPKTGERCRYYTDDPDKYLSVLYECCEDVIKNMDINVYALLSALLDSKKNDTADDSADDIYRTLAYLLG